MERLNVRTNEQEETAAREIPILKVCTGTVGDFVAVAAEYKSAELRLKEARAKVEALGLNYLFKHNTDNPDAPAGSVRLVDSKDQRALVSMQDKVSIPNEKLFVDWCKKAGVSDDDLAHFIVRAEFDDSVFLVDGEFSTVVYNTFLRAVRDATIQLINDGKLSKATKVPLRTAQVLMAKPAFTEMRWHLGLTPSQQQGLHDVAPATVVVKAST